MNRSRRTGAHPLRAVALLAAAVPMLGLAGGFTGASAAAPGATPRPPTILTPGKIFPSVPIIPEQNSPAPQARANAAPLAGAKYDVTAYGFDLARTGNNTAESSLGTANVAGLAPQFITGFANPGSMDATPVGAADVATPNATRDLVYVGNEHGAFGAIDAVTGQVAWERNVGFQHTNCGDFVNGDAGVTGAAVIDRVANRVYAAGGDGRLYAFDPATGADAPGWTPVALTTQPNLLHVYGALTLDTARHTIYAGLASYCDHTPYKGQLVGVDTDSTVVRQFVVIRNTQNGGGIWGWGGASLDANGSPFVATGNALPNGPAEATPYGEYVVKLRGSDLAVLGAHHPVLSGFDLDFGATPTLLDVPGCEIPRLAVQNKNGDLFIYPRDNLTAGPTETLHIATGPESGTFVGLPAYDAVTGTLYVSNPVNGGASPSYPHGMVARRFGSDCRTHPLWNTAAGPAISPVSSPTIANGVVYYGDGTGNAVHAFNAATGAELWHSAPGAFAGPVFSAPMVFGGRLFASSRGGAVHAFVSGGTPLTDPIVIHYNGLGGEGSYLGAPVGSEYAPTPSGLAQNYQFGTIFWSPATGAHEVHGSILAKYRAVFGGPPGLLGYPLTDESRTPDRVGRFNHFAGAGGSSIYWTPKTGAHEVQGAIRAKWAALGWERGPLGYPVTDETRTPDGLGRFNHYAGTGGSSIYWTPKTGAHEVQGAIRAKWAALGWERGRLSYPITDEYAIPNGRRNDFVHGRINWSALNGNIVVTFG